jgi:hypothetical protein
VKKAMIQTLVICSVLSLASCTDQVSKADTPPTTVDSTSTTSTSSTLPEITTTTTNPFESWLKNASTKEKCLKVKEIFDPLPKAGAVSGEASDKYLQLEKIASSLEWSDAYFMSSWDAKQNAGTIKRLLKYGCGFDGYDELTNP